MYFQYKDEKYSPRFAVGGYMHIELTGMHSGTMHAECTAHPIRVGGAAPYSIRMILHEYLVYVYMDPCIQTR